MNDLVIIVIVLQVTSHNYRIVFVSQNNSAPAWLELAAPGETEMVEGVEAAGEGETVPLLHRPVLQQALHQHPPPPSLHLPCRLDTDQKAVAGSAEAIDTFTGVITGQLGAERLDRKSPALQVVGGTGWLGDLCVVVIPPVELGPHGAPQTEVLAQLRLSVLPVAGGGQEGRLAGPVQGGLAQQEESRDQHHPRLQATPASGHHIIILAPLTQSLL